MQGETHRLSHYTTFFTLYFFYPQITQMNADWIDFNKKGNYPGEVIGYF